MQVKKSVLSDAYEHTIIQTNTLRVISPDDSIISINKSSDDSIIY